jgi:hypothetical protein
MRPERLLELTYRYSMRQAVAEQAVVPLLYGGCMAELGYHRNKKGKSGGGPRPPPQTPTPDFEKIPGE